MTLFLSVSACLVGMPLGIVLALGRRSSLPVLRALCTGYIEGVRGVPLISLIFMAAVMFPLLVRKSSRLPPMLV